MDFRVVIEAKVKETANGPRLDESKQSFVMITNQINVFWSRKNQHVPDPDILGDPKSKPFAHVLAVRGVVSSISPSPPSIVSTVPSAVLTL